MQAIVSAVLPEARQLRLHCLCGDDLQWRDLGWSVAAGPAQEEAARGERRLIFRCALADGSERGIEFGLLPQEQAERVLAIARELTLQAADRRWRALAERLGTVPTIHHATTKVLPLGTREIAAARRLVHPSHVVDRLMLRDRAEAVAEIETLLFHARPRFETLRCA